MAEEIRKRHIKNINQDGLELVHYNDIGKQWVPRFLHRHSELASIHSRSIDAVRIKDISSE